MKAAFRRKVAALLTAALASISICPATAGDRIYFLTPWLSSYGQNNFFADPDGDGVVNYVEFGFGTDPLSAAPGQGMDQVQPTVRLNENGQLELVILQPDFPCGSRPAYGRNWFWISVLESTDLRKWREIALKNGANGGFSPREGYSVTATQGGAGQWEIVITEQQPATGAKWFRLLFFIVS